MWLQVVRYYMAILILFGVPVGLLMWLVIHPFHKFLRHLSLKWAYLIVLYMIGGARWNRIRWNYDFPFDS